VTPFDLLPPPRDAAIPNSPPAPCSEETYLQVPISYTSRFDPTSQS